MVETLLPKDDAGEVRRVDPREDAGDGCSPERSPAAEGSGDGEAAAGRWEEETNG
jgi:hypothetical protein